MRPKVLMLLGAALIGSAFIIWLVSEFLRGRGAEVVVTFVRLSALGDALIGAIFLFLGLRKMGEPGG